jgi:hypothetical protein
VLREEHRKLYPGYKYEPKKNPKRRSKAPAKIDPTKRKDREEDPLIESEIVESRWEDKDQVMSYKLPTEAGICCIKWTRIC